MTEQELIQENEKLKGRLAKAIEVFKEQKENIASLTEERDKALADAEFQAAKVQKLEDKLAEKSSNDDKFFEQEEEISKLNVQIDKDKMEIDAACETIDNLKFNIGQLNKEWQVKLEESEAQRDKLEQECKLRKAEVVQKDKELLEAKKSLDELGADYAVLEEKNNSYEEQVAEQQERIENLSTALDKAHEALDQERKETKEYWGRVLDKTEELRVMLTNGQG